MRPRPAVRPEPTPSRGRTFTSRPLSSGRPGDTLPSATGRLAGLTGAWPAAPEGWRSSGGVGPRCRGAMGVTAVRPAAPARRQARSTDPVLPAGGSGRHSLGHPAGTGAAQVSRAGRTAVSWSGVRRRDGSRIGASGASVSEVTSPAADPPGERRRISTMREHGARCGVLERPVRPARATARHPRDHPRPLTGLGRRAHDLGLPGHEVAKLGRWTPCLSGRPARSMPRSTARRAATPRPSRSSTTCARRTSTA